MAKLKVAPARAKSQASRTLEDDIPIALLLADAARIEACLYALDELNNPDWGIRRHTDLIAEEEEKIFDRLRDLLLDGAVPLGTKLRRRLEVLEADETAARLKRRVAS